MAMQGRCCVKAATLRGVEAVPVDVEVSVGAGMPGFSVVGMADASVQESRERVKSAIRACGFEMPGTKVVVNLAPGSLRKTGSGFDLPIAAGILCATGQIDPRAIEGSLFVGELSLEGSVRAVAGTLAYALCSKRERLGLVVSAESSLISVDGVVWRVMRSLSGLRDVPLATGSASVRPLKTTAPDFRDIAGHEMAKRALQIAAAGSHGVLMMGPPGSGKTMLASRLPSILPPLSKEEALETAVVHSVAGEDASSIFAGVRPFRSPHHSASLAGLVGGGSPPRPGEISLAHNGVLFLDELPEFSPSVVQGIRQPLESGRVTITRADGNVEFPARFMVVGASNPCPCGYFGDPQRPCTCSQSQIRHYMARIGGPVLDRIDLHVDVERIPVGQVLATGRGTSSGSLREGVMRAREYASWRRSKTGVQGRERSSEEVVRSCGLDPADEAFLTQSATSASMSGRSVMRTLMLARTIADMEERASVSRENLCEAIGFRLREGA